MPRELSFDLVVPNSHISLGFQGGREGGRTTFTKGEGDGFRVVGAPDAKGIP